MNTFNLSIRFLQRIRFIRPVLDLAIALAAVALIAYLQPALQMKERKQTPIEKPRAATVKQARPVSTQGVHSDESAMWKSWSEWIGATKPSSGHCIFEKDAGNSPYAESVFRIQCDGLLGETTVPPELPQGGLFQKELFANRTGSAGKKTRPAEKYDDSSLKTATPAYKTSGWMDTETGRKHYNPEKRTWQVLP